MLAALGCADGLGLAEMMSNYAKVTTNRDLIATGQTHRMEPKATIRVPETETEAAFNGTEYEDFDDLESSEEPVFRQTPTDSGTVLKVVNGLVSLLTLMYKFGDHKGLGSERVRKESVVAEPRYSPVMPTNKFVHHTDQEKQPISNFPPYNPLTANAADSYSLNNRQTSYEADMEEYKTKNPMGDFQKQNAYDASYHDSPQQDGGWNAIGQDYPVYKPNKPNTNFDGDARHPWKTVDDFPVYTPPDKKPIDYHDFLLHESPEDHHHGLHVPEDEHRVSKRPYSYYFLGRKLWYIPLIFSVYFIIYIGALVLKSFARHKIQFPEKLAELNDDYKHRRYRRVDEATENYANAVVNTKYKLM
ncbi:UNVERIFIED_CONTAM: hypothetical protein PYX00_010696 [Menopon gallinae]|uniref:Uncharacterized protein n=1 Tax=Menopon gallinae TaxID=328185 RepID=A0AAW2HGV3_9NEOP